MDEMHIIQLLNLANSWQLFGDFGDYLAINQLGTDYVLRNHKGVVKSAKLAQCMVAKKILRISGKKGAGAFYEIAH